MAKRDNNIEIPKKRTTETAHTNLFTNPTVNPS